MERVYRHSRDVMAGCTVCHGDNFHWYGKNAQGVAARHHDATGHTTFVEVHATIRYMTREASDLVDDERRSRREPSAG